jgi:hypothetical protein
MKTAFNKFYLFLDRISLLVDDVACFIFALEKSTKAIFDC